MKSNKRIDEGREGCRVLKGAGESQVGVVSIARGQTVPTKPTEYSLRSPRLLKAASTSKRSITLIYQYYRPYGLYASVEANQPVVLFTLPNYRIIYYFYNRGTRFPTI